jgi:hypothetical protein
VAEHLVDALGKGGNGGGDVAVDLLVRETDLHQARLARPGATIVVVVLALAQTPFARAAPDISVAGMFGADVEAAQETESIDDAVGRLAMLGREQELVQVVGGGVIAPGHGDPELALWSEKAHGLHPQLASCDLQLSRGPLRTGGQLLHQISHYDEV